jgi:N-acetylglucosamine-6-phosphate deacetylase
MQLLERLRETQNLPGWVDLQVNGHAGICFFEEGLTFDRVAEATEKLVEAGVAGLLPTVITSPAEVMEHSLQVLGEACADAKLGKHLLGIHLEGPFLSPEPGARGAHPGECMLLPSWDRFSRLQDHAGGNIRLLTLAPELPGALEFIEQASESVVCSGGHTLAGYREMRAAVEAGLRLWTHLGNGIPKEVNRHENPIIYNFAIPELVPSIITDGFHLPEGFIRATIAAKGIAGCFVISDQTHLAGMPAGEYSLGRIPVVLEANGFLHMRDEPYLAGSSRTMTQCMEHLAGFHFLEDSELVQLGFENPLRILGIDVEAFRQSQGLPTAL